MKSNKNSSFHQIKIKNTLRKGRKQLGKETNKRYWKNSQEKTHKNFKTLFVKDDKRKNINQK